MMSAYLASRGFEGTTSGKTVSGIVAITAFGVVVAGCGSGSTGTELDGRGTATFTAAAAGSTTKVLVSDPTDASMAALGGGKIEIIGGCLGAGGPVIIWPPGTRVIGKDPVKIRIPLNGDYSVGDTVKLGGGFISDPTDSATRPLKVGSVEVPTNCLGQGVFLAGPATPVG